jgi:hypothetical protein
VAGAVHRTPAGQVPAFEFGQAAQDLSAPGLALGPVPPAVAAGDPVFEPGDGDPARLRLVGRKPFLDHGLEGERVAEGRRARHDHGRQTVQRARFGLKVEAAAAAELQADRSGHASSPWSAFQAFRQAQ